MEKIASEDPRESPVAMALDINIMRRLQGRERTLKQYGDLLADHGFQIKKTVQTPGDVYACCTDVILAIKE